MIVHLHDINVCDDATGLIVGTITEIEVTFKTDEDGDLYEVEVDAFDPRSHAAKTLTYDPHSRGIGQAIWLAAQSHFEQHAAAEIDWRESTYRAVRGRVVG